jgi:hypothetical protein
MTVLPTDTCVLTLRYRDKRQILKDLPHTDPVSCELTGGSTVVPRKPDATFGLATFSEIEPDLSVCANELRRTRLEKLLLHHKCGLLADPKWGETDLVFPFAVYEAKGWAGDCREARHQACLAGATYLDMLDDVVRKPGPVGSTKPYQTVTSHHYQVFALTSFGAHWHLLVGYRRPRQEDEHRERKGMSETVYVRDFDNPSLRLFAANDTFCRSFRRYGAVVSSVSGLLGSFLRSSTRSTCGLPQNSGPSYSSTCDLGTHSATKITS